MTDILVHELPGQTEALMERLRTLLETVPGASADEYLRRAVIAPADRPRMVLTGQFSSGKSSLIKALTDGAVDPAIDADIATDDVTSYEWDGAVTLVDTPGVQSGLRTHDQLASDAVASADFILFVITVGLFDDASRDYLRYLAHGRELFPQMVVVITQTSKQSAAEGVRERAVQDALGTATSNLPISEVDSVYYLRSLDGGPRAETLRERSGIDDLRARINSISEARGRLAQLRQPLQLIRQLCDESQTIFAEDEKAKLALALLASQAAAITERRRTLEDQVTTAEASFRSRCLDDVRGFVDTASALPGDGAEASAALKDAEARLVEALERHASVLAARINQLAESEFDRLEERLNEIGDENRATRLSQLAEIDLDTPHHVTAKIAGGSSEHGAGLRVDWAEVADLIKKGQGWWGAGSGGLKGASGSMGHRVVKDVGHAFGAKFKPWQAVKIADTIGKAARVGGFAIQVGAAAYGVWQDERRARAEQVASERQHAALITEIMAHADGIAADARRQLAALTEPIFDQILTPIRAQQEEILKARASRSAGATELASISSEAERLLQLSAVKT
jgi:hypothetical protein